MVPSRHFHHHSVFSVRSDGGGGEGTARNESLSGDEKDDLVPCQLKSTETNISINISTRDNSALNRK